MKVDLPQPESAATPMRTTPSLMDIWPCWELRTVVRGERSAVRVGASAEA